MLTFDSLFYLFFFGIAAFFVFRFVKYGGLRGALYGSKVVRTVGELEIERSKGLVTTLRVHVLENGKVVLESSSRATFGASIQGLPMDRASIGKLIDILKRVQDSAAANEK